MSRGSRMKDKDLDIRVSLKEYSPEAVRYAAYALSSEAYVSLRSDGRQAAVVAFSPKQGRPDPGLRKRFMAELADEKLREAVCRENGGLRELLLMKALSAPAAPAAKDSGLTPEQEKELEDLIAQVEKEIKQEAVPVSKDPLGITKTWEERYGGRRKK